MLFYMMISARTA